MTAQPLELTYSRRAINPWIVALAVVIPTFMEVLDTTIANVALRYIAGGLSAPVTDSEWVITSYLAANAIILPITGWLSAHLGRRNYFLLSIAVFTLASAVCGFAPNIGVLIVARFVQGAGAAATMPQIMSVIQARFSGRDRARALSAYSAVIASGFVAGQVLGGLLVNANLFGTQWRAVFLVNVPIGAVVLALAPRLIPRDGVASGSRPGSGRRVDLAGLRAVADDHEAAMSVGIALRRVWVVAWMLSGLVAIVAGILWGNRIGVGFAVSLIAFKALPVLIIGGIDSIPGAIVGGLIVGATESLAEGFIGPLVGGGVQEIFPYLVALVFLMVRPYGLFGRPIIERV